MLTKNNFKRQFLALNRTVRIAAIGVAIIGLVGGASGVYADQYDEQIRALNNQNNASQGVINGLAAQASTYQGAISALQAQINAVQSQIYANQAEQNKVTTQMEENKATIAKKKGELSATVKAMYIDGETSTIEQLATSKNLSDYIDKEEYRTAVQNQLNGKIKEIAALQLQLQSQKQKLDDLLATQRAQNQTLGAAQGEQNRLLAMNEGQQAAYNGQIASNNKRIQELRRQQAAANARFTGGPAGTGANCGGGYPAKWCNIPMDSVLDDWGMYNRECVSYTAFRVAASGRHMPKWGFQGRGNANQWDDNARAAGIPVDGNPRPGDIAVSNAGYYGHVMYVESVNANGTINISQYNASWDGRYSTRSGVSPAGLVFIHF